MKRIFSIFSILTVLGGAFAFTSCDQNGKNATPEVRFVRSCDPVYAEKLLTEVSMGSTIAIIGNNLGDVVRIDFNDQTAKLNPTLVTNTSIVVTVPSTMPTDITNKIYLTTSTGKGCEYDFGVIIPSPSATSISCEWAPAGDDVTIYGNYFFAKDDGTIDVLFPGNAVAQVTDFTNTEIHCIVPDNATVEGNISITSAYGTSRSNFTWRNSEGIFIDFTDLSWNWWGYGDFGTEDGVDGQYAHLYGSSGSWAWPGGTLWVLYFSNSGECLLPDDAEVSDYSLVFEYKITEWGCNVPLAILFDDTGAASFDNSEAQYHWIPSDEGFTADKWMTKTIPLDDFNTNKEENEDRHISKSDMVNFIMAPFGAADDSGYLDFCVDNIRLVKND
ncbi:MAG: glycan-binding surface protein [Bacteroidales bacterium]|nr:glycan-binding surface protein [Bacteroidales bacterium]